MNNLINSLEICWYISPPWGKEIPPMVICLLERVYLPKFSAFGYCCGVEWGDNIWNYSIALDNKIVSVPGVEMIPTGQIQSTAAEKPVFMVGELVNFRFGDHAAKVRTVLGLQLINGSCLYGIEWRSPALQQPD
ncbi:DUF1392 family protein [Nodularia sp. LEGE 04288]|uniref:DUF1392 family protein n=1 Tax=Nodularia sp. LEGE 04288 TaxID=1828639 RepID=UPI001D0FCC9B|nr:DUF1392 family protein [Nodularia sp. LEGE 04288]MCC2693885.1 DUF1392 family protein [Nodularia sp. LEGE 04288]